MTNHLADLLCTESSRRRVCAPPRQEEGRARSCQRIEATILNNVRLMIVAIVARDGVRRRATMSGVLIASGSAERARQVKRAWQGGGTRQRFRSAVDP